LRHFIACTNIGRVPGEGGELLFRALSPPVCPCDGHGEDMLGTRVFPIAPAVTFLVILVVTSTEERRLVEEEGMLPKKTWLQKKEDLRRVGELLYRALLFIFW